MQNIGQNTSKLFYHREEKEMNLLSLRNEEGAERKKMNILHGEEERMEKTKREESFNMDEAFSRARVLKNKIQFTFLKVNSILN